MKPSDFTRRVQKKVAISAVGPSALRGQGKGFVDCAHDFLASMRLHRVPHTSERAFAAWLDRQTEELVREFPSRQRRWGGARKVINLFLRDVLYNRYLCREYRFSAVERWLEAPLDGVVARQLKKRDDLRVLPPWPGLKRVTPDQHARYQRFARKVAAKKGLKRVHLDLYLWSDNR